MLTVTSKCYPHIVFYLTSKFPKKPHELKVNKKNSREASKTRAEKVILGWRTQFTRHKGHIRHYSK